MCCHAHLSRRRQELAEIKKQQSTAQEELNEEEAH